MNLFYPRTFSTDWEVMVIDRLERCVQTDKLMAFAGYLRQACDLPVQIWNRIRTVTDRATQIVGEFELDLFPAGAHPVEEMFNAAHIHVGSIYDESKGVYLENQLLKYAPAFAALAANSPL